MTVGVVAVAVIIVVIAVALLALVLLRRPARRATLPYERRKFLLSAAERSLYGVLEQVARGEYHVFAKVRVADVLYVKKGADERQGHLNRITAKHVDFLLCDLPSVSPLLAVELDDSSHDAESRQRRDAFLDEAFAAAGIPLLHVKASRSYDANELAVRVKKAIEGLPLDREKVAP